MELPFKLVDREMLWSQWKWLKTQLDQTEKLLIALGEEVPLLASASYSPPTPNQVEMPVGRAGTLTANVRATYSRIAEDEQDFITSASVLADLQRHGISDADPNAISAILGKDADSGILTRSGTVPGSKMIRYSFGLHPL